MKGFRQTTSPLPLTPRLLELHSLPRFCIFRYLQVDLMVLYSVSALTAQGGITPQQMDSIILESIVGSNDAMINSGVAAYLNAVHIGLVRLLFQIVLMTTVDKTLKCERILLQYRPYIGQNTVRFQFLGS